MDNQFDLLLIILLGITIAALEIGSKLQKKKQIKDVVFRPFTTDELKRYNFYKRIVFFISLSGSLVLFLLALGSWTGSPILYIIIFIACFAIYVMFFFGKPQGIMSAKITHVEDGLPYYYDLSLEKTNAKLSGMPIWFINHWSFTKSSEIKDKNFILKVAKSKLGFPFVFLDVQHVDRKNGNLDAATKSYLKKMKIGGNVLYAIGLLTLFLVLSVVVSTTFKSENYYTFAGLTLAMVIVCISTFYIGYKFRNKPEELIRNWKKGETKWKIRQ